MHYNMMMLFRYLKENIKVRVGNEINVKYKR